MNDCGETCFECGAPAEHDHHVVPKSRGGTGTVPLCGACHAKAHHRRANMANRELTRQALARAKARGVKLGAARPECRHNLKPDARAKGAAVSAKNRVRRAIEEQSDIAAIASEMRHQGASLRRIATHLNHEGFPTRDGSTFDPETGQGGWSATQVKRVLDRAQS